MLRKSISDALTFLGIITCALSAGPGCSCSNETIDTSADDGYEFSREEGEASALFVAEILHGWELPVNGSTWTLNSSEMEDVTIEEQSRGADESFIAIVAFRSTHNSKPVNAKVRMTYDVVRGRTGEGKMFWNYPIEKVELLSIEDAVD